MVLQISYSFGKYIDSKFSLCEIFNNKMLHHYEMPNLIAEKD